MQCLPNGSVARLDGFEDSRNYLKAPLAPGRELTVQKLCRLRGVQ